MPCVPVASILKSYVNLTLGGAPIFLKSMALKKHLLVSPGPTPVPPQVSLSGAAPIIHHRTPQFQAIMKEVAENLKYLFCTKNDVLIIPCSGTGVMEAAVSNLMSPGETMVTVEGGKFGERWSSIGKAFGCETVPVTVEYGKTVSPKQIEAVLKQHPKTKALFIQFSETSTGCVYDIEAIAKITKNTNTLLVVDGISAVGAIPCYPDAWGIDVILTGSQKGLMLPPGLGFISLNDHAWAAVETSKCPRFYFDLNGHRKSLQAADNLFTPAISLIVQLREALKIIREETIEGVWKRHAWLADATRAAATALKLELFAERPGNTVTAMKVPAGLDGGKLVKTMRDELGVTPAGGQGTMKGKILRIAHLGYMDRFDILTAVAALEIALKRQNYSFKAGIGLSAAQEILCNDPN